MNQPIPPQPYLKPWYRIAREEKRLVLEYANEAVVFKGEAVQRLLPALLPLLDGSRSLEQIIAAIGLPVEPAVRNALLLLAKSRLLIDGPPVDADTPPPVVETAHFLSASSHSNIPVAETRTALERARLGVAGSGGTAEEIARLLRRSGVESVERLSETEVDHDGAGLELAIVAPQSEDLPRLRDWNRLALHHRIAWLQVLPFDGKLAAIGPLFLPGETCCYECYRLRRLSNLEYADEFPALESSPATYPEPPSIGSAVAGLATALALRWIAHRDQVLPGAFYAFEHTMAFNLTFHRVYRVPRCPECSGLAGTASPLPWYKEVRVEGR